MEVKIRQALKVLAAIALIAAALPLHAFPDKEKADSLVRIMKAESLELKEINGQQYRKAIASTFLHNGTYLISDTALWNVDTKVINAWGHVKVIQDETILTSDKLDYLIDEDLAQFRGTTVQLENKKLNQLRTRYLDYNTRDSMAVFRNGGAMRDEKGQIIESLTGTYDSRRKYFTFENDVNMFTDSIFVKTGRLLYYSETEKAEFPGFIDFWKGGNMLSAGMGWYDRGRERFFFTRNVHGQSREQEMWADTLYYYRTTNDIHLMGNAQVQDSSRRTTGMADRIYYSDSLQQVMMRKRAAIAMETTQGERTDTVYVGADTLIYRTIPRCDVDDATVKACESRLSDILTDAVTEFRRKAAEAAAQAAEEARQKKPGAGLSRPGSIKPGGAENDTPEDDSMDMRSGPETADSTAVKDAKAAADLTTGKDLTAAGATIAADTGTAALTDSTAAKDTSAAIADSTAATGLTTAAADSTAARDSISAGEGAMQTPPDSAALAAAAIRDSIAAAERARLDSLFIADSLARADSIAFANRDTTKIGFAYGIRNVRIFRKDIQVRCDSLSYCDLDSIARFYLDPVVWNDGNRQYTADSIFVLVGGGSVRKASLQSDAFVITQEDEVSYDQIKGAEIMAYFDSTDSALKRFDALGGASAIFFIRENEAFATVNKVDSKMLSAILVNGNIDQVSYFETPKNNAYPVVQLPEQERKMKGFNWRPDEKPTGPQDITTMKIRKSQRAYFSRKPQASFKQTETYFPGYMPRIRREIAIRDSLAALGKSARDTSAKTVDAAVSDSLTVQDSTVMRDLPAPADTTAVSDSLRQQPAPADTSLAAPADPLAVPYSDPKQQRREEKELKRKLRIAERDARIAAREAKWAELDRRDSLKREEKKQKAMEKERAKTLKALQDMRRQEAKDEAKLQKYIEKYRKQYEREKARSAARKRAPGVEARGEVPADPESGEPPAGSDAVLRDDGTVDDGPVLGGGGLPGA